MSLPKLVLQYWRKKRFEQRCSCRVHPGGEILVADPRHPESITVGPHTHIRGQLLTFSQPGRITMGSYCYVGENSRLWSVDAITIGDRVLIAHNCSIFDSDTHPIEPDERHKHFVEIIERGHPSEVDLRQSRVTIEDDVWIGCNVVVLKGVTIGRCSIVSAGSVVTEDVPAYSVVAGNPAQVVRELLQP